METSFTHTNVLKVVVDDVSWVSSRYTTPWEQRGLVCLKSDTEGREDALRKYTEKRDWLWCMYLIGHLTEQLPQNTKHSALFVNRIFANRIAFSNMEKRELYVCTTDPLLPAFPVTEDVLKELKDNTL